MSKAEFCRVVPNNGNFPSLLVRTDLSTAFPKKGQELVFSVLLHAFRALLCLLNLTRLEEDSAYERGGDARRKFSIKPLKETDLGVAPAFFDP